MMAKGVGWLMRSRHSGNNQGASEQEIQSKPSDAISSRDGRVLGTGQSSNFLL